MLDLVSNSLQPRCKQQAFIQDRLTAPARHQSGLAGALGDMGSHAENLMTSVTGLEVQATRLPSGHPEGFVEAFANIYLGVAADIRARLDGTSAATADYPQVEDGARGVCFIHKVLESSHSQAKWTVFD